jgi:hypothetical protein
MTRTCDQCGKHLITHRADARFCDEDCKNAWHNKQRRSQDGPHKRLAAVSEAETPAIRRIREGQEAAKAHWSMIVREGIIEVLKGTGAYHADDLDHLGIPDEHRNIIGSQTAKLVNQKWIEGAGRRKSILPSRNGAKSGIYKLTDLGKSRIAGVEGERSCSSDVAGHGLGHSLDSGEAGLTGPGSGAGAKASTLEASDGPHVRPSTSTASPDEQLAGVSTGRPTPQGEEGLESQKPAGAHSGEIRNRPPESGTGTPSPQGSGGAILPCSSAGTALPDSELAGDSSGRRSSSSEAAAVSGESIVEGRGQPGLVTGQAADATHGDASPDQPAQLFPESSYEKLRDPDARAA